MKFLIVTESRDPVPPEMALGMLDMMDTWLAANRSSGKLLDAWSFAGKVGGGGILEVESHEELDAVMAMFPFNATSTVSVYPLADLDAALANTRKTFEMIASQG